MRKSNLLLHRYSITLAFSTFVINKVGINRLHSTCTYIHDIMAEEELQVEWKIYIKPCQISCLTVQLVVTQSSASSSSYPEQCSVHEDSLVSDYWEVMGEGFHHCTHVSHTNSVPHVLTFSKMSIVCVREGALCWNQQICEK